jgi:hypothetical protein
MQVLPRRAKVSDFETEWLPWMDSNFEMAIDSYAFEKSYEFASTYQKIVD